MISALSYFTPRLVGLNQLQHFPYILSLYIHPKPPFLISSLHPTLPMVLSFLMYFFPIYCLRHRPSPSKGFHQSAVHVIFIVAWAVSAEFASSSGDLRL